MNESSTAAQELNCISLFVDKIRLSKYDITITKLVGLQVFALGKVGLMVLLISKNQHVLVT